MIATMALVASITPASAQDMRLSGSWQLPNGAVEQLTTADGKPAPYTAAAQEILQARLSEQSRGQSTDGVEVSCLPPGIPRLMTTATPFTFILTPSKVTLLHEFQHTIRHVHLNEDMPSEDDIDPFFGGTSVGRWDGNVLVVKTGRFNDQIRLDSAGSPQSADATITERFKVSDDGTTLENLITIEDPENYSAPWTARIVYNRSDVSHLKEDVCAYKILHPTLRSRIEGASS